MQNEDLITPENIDELLADEETEEQEAETETVDANPEEETETETEEQEAETETVDANPEEVLDTSVEIGGQKYSREEIEQIFHVGKSVKEYQEEHPGFDPILLHRDYTKKTKKLSELEKELASRPPAVSSQPTEGASIDEIAQNLGVNQEDVKTVQKIAKALGFVDANEFRSMEQQRTARDYETIKQEKINAFIEKHPEYHPSQDKDDKNWGSLLEEFSLYRLPEDPAKIGVLLEKAHKVIKGVDIKPLDAGKIFAQTKVNKVGKSSSQGGATATKESKSEKGIPELARQNLKGFTEQELEDLFN